MAFEPQHRTAPAGLALHNDLVSGSSPSSPTTQSRATRIFPVSGEHLSLFLRHVHIGRGISGDFTPLPFFSEKPVHIIAAPP
jgi:hypothetical protein